MMHDPDLEDKRGGWEVLLWTHLWGLNCMAAAFTASSAGAAVFVVLCVLLMWRDLDRLFREDIARLERKREQLRQQDERLKRLRGDE